MASIEREIEKGLLNAVSGITGLNFFTSERGTARTMPNIVVQASIGGEELGPFTGVFKTPATLTYTARADTISRTAFDAKFYDILEQLYRSPDLASYITTATNITCYVAKITSEGNSVVATNRTWNRAITLDIIATAKKFLPSNLTSLSLWLKADAGVTLSGSHVTAWADQSGNGNNTDDYGGYSPLFVSNVKNSKPVIRFGSGGNTTVLKTTSTNSIGNSGNITIIAVYNYNHSGNDWAEVFAKTDLAAEANSQFSLTAQFINGENLWTNAFSAMDASSGYNWNYSSTTTLYDNEWIIHEGISDVTNNSQKMFINTSEVSSSGSINEINALDIKIGIGNAGADAAPESPAFGGFQGDIAEIIVYDKALTTPERQQVEMYLNNKYAIY